MSVAPNSRYCRWLANDPDSRCLWSKSGCGRDSPWVEFLILHGANGTNELRGKSAAAKRKLYTKYKAKLERCKDVRARGAHFDREIRPDICSWIADVEAPTHPSDWRWRNVLAEIRKKKILDNNFDPTRMTPDTLYTVAQVMNTHLYAGSIDMDDVDFTVEHKRDEEVRGTAMASKVEHKEIVYYAPAFFETSMYFKHGYVVRVDDVVTTNLLEFLVHTLAHEMMHLVSDHLCSGLGEGVEAENAGGHHDTFLALNKRFHGHSDKMYCYSSHAVPSTDNRETYKRNLKIHGESMRFCTENLTRIAKDVTTVIRRARKWSELLQQRGGEVTEAERKDHRRAQKFKKNVIADVRESFKYRTNLLKTMQFYLKSSRHHYGSDPEILDLRRQLSLLTNRLANQIEELRGLANMLAASAVVKEET
eukprot:jgi/Mesvir1/28837/Mv14805-RA.1